MLFHLLHALLKIRHLSLGTTIALLVVFHRLPVVLGGFIHLDLETLVLEQSLLNDPVLLVNTFERLAYHLLDDELAIAELAALATLG